MRYTTLGSLEISVIGIGCNNFGRALDAEGSAVVVNSALDEGINFFDTADNYGTARSESYLGQALGARRDEAIVATKFANEVPGVPGSGGARPEYVRSAAERSLRELGTDHIDLYQLHFPDPETPIEETIGAMAELVEQGKVREIACSNLDAAQLEAALAASGDGGYPAFVSDQIEYSLINRAPEQNGLADVALRNGVALLPYYPLACGLLTGKVSRGEEPQGRLKMERYQHYLSDENFDLVDGLRGFVADRDLTMPQLALGWLLSRPAVPAVTPGATTPEQVRSNAGAADWEPSADDLAELERLIGG